MTADPKSRRVTPRVWTTLALSGAALGLGVSGSLAAGHSPDATPPDKLWRIQATSEGGEGGEAGQHSSDGSVNWATVDILMDAGMLEGYLRASVALYHAGNGAAAAIHFKAPGDEICDELSAHLGAIGLPAFDDALTALASAAAAAKPAAEIDSAFKIVVEKVDALGGTLRATDRERATAIMEVLRRAEEDYGNGVVEGRVSDPVEYADAWGFVQAARAMALRMEAAGDAPASAFGKKAGAAIESLAPLLPGVDGSGLLARDSTIFPAVLAEIELAAYRLK